MAHIAHTPTPHNSAVQGDFAKTCLLPGDPLRAKFMNGVRNILGYTGTYKGKEISVMGSGMGMPSIGIYSFELFNYYGCENLIRIGSAGSINENVHINDIVVAEGASTTSAWQDQYNLNGHFSATASWELLYKCAKTAERLGTDIVVGSCLSEDVFYNMDRDVPEIWGKMGILCLEMEAAALYMNAARWNKKALAIFTISDEIYSGRELSALDRERSFTKMMELALETGI